MLTIVRQRRWSAIAGSALLLLCAAPGHAQESYDSYDTYGSRSAPRANDAYSGRSNDAYRPQEGSSARGRANDAYSPSGDAYGAGRTNDAYSPGRGDAYAPSRQNDAYAPQGGGTYDNGGSYNNRGPDPYASGDAYSPTRNRQTDSYSGRPSDPGGYGEPYAPPPGEAGYADGGPPPASDKFYSQNEIVSAGHSFFGAISQGLAQGVEYAFKSQGRPNGYILGEDAGGAFVVGLRYGEGRLYTKNAGEHKVFWQGPSVGYDAGAEGSKTMVLVYNLRDPSQIYERFGGAEGSAYLVGGVSVQFQTYNNVTLAVIRSGVGVRLGANVGYLKYTRTPTWNPL